MSRLVSEESKKALREIGLTEYEIRAYLYLLQAGEITASQLSENTDVPYSKVYEVLNSLEKKGWIKNQGGRPRLYYPKSPTEALEATKLRLDNMVKTWQKSVVEELQPLYDKRGIREKPDVWILSGEFDAFAKLKEMIENTENELMIAAPPLANPLIEIALPMLKSLVATKVRLFIMFSETQNLDLKEFSKFGEVRVRNEMFGGGVIADSREALLILGEKKPLIIWSDHLGLVKFAKDYFQHLWNTARQI
ncbi:MAG: TrmB family transcriptional regulator [Candidatus Bathyarchaeia archaeon]